MWSEILCDEKQKHTRSKFEKKETNVGLFESCLSLEHAALKPNSGNMFQTYTCLRRQ